MKKTSPDGDISFTWSLGPYEDFLERRLALLKRVRFGERLWSGDPTLWKRDTQHETIIRRALGWLHLAEVMEKNLSILLDFTSEIRREGYRHVVHLGMGGSSLAPLVLREVVPKTKPGLPLEILDTTDPHGIGEVERRLPLPRTLFITASKSGTTVENIALEQYFYTKLTKLKGPKAGENFVAITDSESPLEKRAQERSFRRTFRNVPNVGGRYSALSYVGLLPAALMGIDLIGLLGRARQMEQRCGPAVQPEENPALILGAALGELCRQGRDKATFLMPPELASFGLWLEQLIAESTGKEGKGILPIVDEPLGIPSSYNRDRFYVAISLRGKRSPIHTFLRRMEERAEPVLKIVMDDPFDLAQEFLRWELAIATAGAILRINPFDQPNVQESKERTERLLDNFQATGRLPQPEPLLETKVLRFFGSKKLLRDGDPLHSFFEGIRPGSYITMLAYLPETSEIVDRLQRFRKKLRDTFRVATTLGFGPRYLHSTGQYHKGGPNKGFFIQLAAEDEEDLSVPNRLYTFRLLWQAQAWGDLGALQKHRRRALRIDLGHDVTKGLDTLSRLMTEAKGSRLKA